MARIFRDAYGVPHVRATDVLDLARGQGAVTARDRSWQLEFQRRRATGTTAEALGPAGLPWDRLARRTRIAETARRAHARLEAETQSFLAAYVEGVNTGLDADAAELRALDLEPAAWEPWTPLAVFLGQHLLFASLATKLFLQRAAEVLGEDAWLLSHEGPETSGSNAWAVGGGRTLSGRPLIGGDPHRSIESPGVYMQVRLACESEGIDVLGFAFPGVPGVQHFAHAGPVAWAITNAMADYQDVYAEQLRRSGSGVEALGPEGWEPASAHVEEIPVRGAPVESVEVVLTDRGAVFSGGVDEGRGLSLRTASGVLTDLGFDALLPLLRARTVADVDTALDRWVEPVNNVVAADTEGRVLYRVAGRVPVRDDANRRGIVDAADARAGWTGWVGDLPRTEVGPDEAVVTANERRGPESDRIGRTFAPPHRADRLRALIGDRTDLDAASFAEFHADVRLPALAPVLELLGPLMPGEAGAAVRDRILDWDGEMEAGSAGAAAFAAWRSAFVRRLAAEPVFAGLARPAVDDPVLVPYLDPTARIGAAVENLVAAGSPFGLDLPALATAALDDAAGHPETWGETHVVTPLHAFDLVPCGHDAPALPRLAVGGDTDCVRCTASLPGLDDSCWRGSVARYAWDLADREAGGWVVPLGASGLPESPHHADQLPLWTDVRLAPIVTSWERLIRTQDVPGLGTLTFHPFDPATESELLHSWVSQDRARFWMMQDHTVEEVREVYTWIDEQPTHHAWLTRLDGEPVALFQDYRPTAEEVGEHYDVQPGDLGVHFFMGPTDRPRRGFSTHLMRAFLDGVFADPATRRVVVEPDVRNEKSVALVRRLGMELGPVVELSTKPAQLAFLTRAAWAASAE